VKDVHHIAAAVQVDHDPQEAPPSYVARYPGIYPARATFNAMSSVLDDVVGNVTAKLQALGLWDNTLLVRMAAAPNPRTRGPPLSPWH
jgi:arylsulfatase A-like enzyme